MFIKVSLSVVAALFLSIGLGLMVVPSMVTESLGMPLLDGLGRSTQLGDLAGFFTGGAIMIILGILQNKKIWFYCPAILVGLTAVFRFVAWLAHDASAAVPQILLEIVIVVLLYFAARNAND